MSAWFTSLGLAIGTDRIGTGPAPTESKQAVPFFVNAVLQTNGCPRGYRVVDTNVTLSVANLVGGDGSDGKIVAGLNTTDVRLPAAMR